MIAISKMASYREIALRHGRIFAMKRVQRNRPDGRGQQSARLPAK
jgi:hypothetical protein